MKVALAVFAACMLLGSALGIDSSMLQPISQHSFHSPFSTGRGGIRGWNYGGSVSVFHDHIRLTQDVQSQIGYIWNRNPLTFKDWEVTVSMRIDGKGRLGGDGIAFWYVEDPGVEGKAYGSKEVWKGLGVFIDTFDNDNKRDNPYISVVVNDGTKTYVPETDSKDIEICGCRAAFRKTSGPALLRVKYVGTLLEVDYDLKNNGDWVQCYSGNVDLPRYYYLGLTAATGGVSDNHDVYSFELRKLDDEAFQPNKNRDVRNTKTPEEKARDEKAAQEMANLKQQLEELKKVTTENKPSEKAVRATDLPAGDLAGRVSLLEEQLKQMEQKMAAIAKVAGGIDTVSSAVEQLKQRIEKNEPSVAYDPTSLKAELNRQNNELNRVISKSQESVKSSIMERLVALERSASDIRNRVNGMTKDSKKFGGGGVMSVAIIIVMVAETILLLVMFMKNRNANKYDKMW